MVKKLIPRNVQLNKSLELFRSVRKSRKQAEHDYPSGKKIPRQFAVTPSKRPITLAKSAKGLF